MSKVLRVLHVEDSERDVALLARHLARAGYDLTSERVETPEAMRAALESREWDVILCDFSMPHFNALAALNLLQEMKLDIPFIIISGTVGEDIAVEAMRAGATDYLMKDKLARLAPTIEREMHEAENRHARRRAEEALRESEDRYRDLVEHSHDLICTHDFMGQILSANQTAVKVLGYDQATLLNKNIRDILFTEYRGEFNNYIRELQEKGVAHGLMYVQTRTGEKRIWEYTNTLRTEGVAEPIVRGVAHDVTEQKRAEAALKASESQLRALFAAMTDIVIVLDREGRYIEIMATNADLLYRPSSDLLGRTMREVFPKEEANFFLSHVRRALNEGRMHSVEYRIEIEGTEVWFDGSVSPISKDQVIWVARDITERKRAEQQIRLQATALETAANAIVITDNQGAINWVNPAFTTLTGYTLEEVAGQNPSILKSDKQDPTFYRELWETILSGRVWHGELINRRKDGSLYFEEQSITPLLNERGEIVNFISIKQDITERRRVEAELRRSEAQYRRLIETTFEGVWIFDAELRTSYVNQRLAEMLGVNAEEMLGRPALDFVPEVSRADLQQRLERRTQGIREQYDLRLRRKDGSHLWAIVSATPILDEHGVFTGSLSMLTDITERKRAEEALRQSEERYRLLFARNPQPMWVFDVETLFFLEVNEAAIHHYGYSREEFLAMTIKDIRPPEELRKLFDNMSASPSLHEEAGVWKHLKKDGTVIDVEINAHELTFRERRAQIVLAYDVTERIGLEEQLRQAQKLEAVGQLAGGIAHDFNNLLTAITGYAELGLRRLHAEDPLQHHLREIKKAAGRAASLTGQLLAFSRKQILQPKVINLNEVVSDMDKMLRRLIGEDISLLTKTGPGLGNVRADPGQVGQVIMNLAVNARDAMPKGGSLTIETANVHLDAEYAGRHVGVRPGAYVMLAVSDTGTGMDEATKARVFEPFFTTKEQGKGTGLGLSTVYGIAKQSGGNVWVYSEVGVGTTFKIYLPRADEEAQEAHGDALVVVETRGTETIILAEDDEGVRRLAREVLEASGYKVLETPNGEAALRTVEQHEGDIHLLLTDVVMPKMSGRDLSERLKELRPGIRVLFMSGYTNDAIIHHGILGQDINFIQKPFSPDDLLKKIRQTLDS